MNRSFMHELMNPSSVAIVGASNNPMKMGTMHGLSILKDGYKGKFYPVHRTEENVLGHKAYKSALDLPEAPDLAIFVLPSEHLISIFEEFGKIGTKHAIIITAGFKETGIDGREMEKKLIETAEKYSMRFIGPNCMGIINTEISLNTTVVPYRDRPGSLAFASQSGTYITQSLPYLEHRGIRLSKAISVGNQANVDIVDALQYLGEDEQTKAVALYLEALSDPERFLKTAREVSSRKPVVVQYVGGSEAGARSGLSHTGAMAGPDHFYDGLFKQAGLIRVDSIEELYYYGSALATQPPLRGNRLAVITNSGGPGSAMADTAESLGFTVPAFSEALQKEIKPLMPAHAPAGNPVDLTFSMDIAILAEKIPSIVMKSGEVDALVLHGAMSSGFMKKLIPHLEGLIPEEGINKVIEDAESRDLSSTVSLPFENNMPMTVSSFFDRDDHYTASFLDNDIPVFDSPEKAARAMGALLKYKKIKEREPATPAEAPAVNPEAAAIIKKAMDEGRGALSEYEAKRILALYGIAISKEMTASNVDEALSAAEYAGYPVAVKACGHEILHKTGKNLIHLNVAGPDALKDAFEAIRASAGADTEVLVSEMVKGEREFLTGMVREKGFGLWTAFGLGGIFAEAFKDIVYRLAPLSDAEAGEMIFSIKSSSILENYRGMERVNTDLLASIIKTLSFIPVLHPEIDEIDINPLIIKGSEPVVVDALLSF